MILEFLILQFIKPLKQCHDPIGPCEKGLHFPMHLGTDIFEAVLQFQLVMCRALRTNIIKLFRTNISHQ